MKTVMAGRGCRRQAGSLEADGSVRVGHTDLETDHSAQVEPDPIRSADQPEQHAAAAGTPGDEPRELAV